MATQLPIVLAHGFARFDYLLEILRSRMDVPESDLEDQFQYFKGIRSHLEAAGFDIYHPNQDFAGGVDLRATQLADRINEILSRTGAARVHIIAHSMGGLDARHMIVDKGMAGRVATLTTIATPHLGTTFVDHVMKHGGMMLVEGLRKVINADGLIDLSSQACAAFNARAEDDEARNGVTYQTYASAENLHLVFAPLIPSWIIIRDQEGQNDGLVSVRSQQWKPELIATDGTRKRVSQHHFPFPADHLNEVGWWDPHEVVNPLFGLVSIFKQAKEYESKVRDLYLQIANALP